MSINNHLNFHPISFSASESQDLEVTYPSPSSTDTQLQLELLRPLATARNVTAYIADLRKSGQEGLIPRFFLMDAQNSTSKSPTPSSSSVHSNKTLSERQISPLPPSSSITSETSLDSESDEELPQDEELNDSNLSDATPLSSSNEKSMSHKRIKSFDSLDLLLQAGLAADARESPNEASNPKKTPSSQKKRKHSNKELEDKEDAVSTNITESAKNGEKSDKLGAASASPFRDIISKIHSRNLQKEQSNKVRLQSLIEEAAASTNVMEFAENAKRSGRLGRTSIYSFCTYVSNFCRNGLEKQPAEISPQNSFEETASFSQHSNQTQQAASTVPLPSKSAKNAKKSGKLNAPFRDIISKLHSSKGLPSNNNRLDNLIAQAATSNNIREFARKAKDSGDLGSLDVKAFCTYVSKFRSENGLGTPKDEERLDSLIKEAHASTSVKKFAKNAQSSGKLGNTSAKSFCGYVTKYRKRLKMQSPEISPQRIVEETASFSQHSNQTQQAASTVPLPSSTAKSPKATLALDPYAYAKELFRPKPMIELPRLFF